MDGINLLIFFTVAFFVTVQAIYIIFRFNVSSEWNDEMVEDAFDFLLEELPLPPNAPGGKVLYRRSLVPSLFYKFYLFVRNELSKNCMAVEPLPEKYLSGISGFHSKDLKSSQYFQVVCN